MNNIENGKKWIADAFHMKAHKKGVFIKTECKGSKNGKGIKLDKCSVGVSYNKKNVVVNFSENDLKNWNSKKVQDRLIKRIQMVIDSLVWTDPK